MDLDAVAQGDVVGTCQQGAVVGFAHVGEAGTGGEILAAQGMLGEKVDVVADEHDVADVEIGVHASGGVADEEGLDAEFVHHPYGEGDGLHVVPFVIVEASLHGKDGSSAEMSEEETSGMSLHGRHGEVGDVGIVECVGHFYFFGQTSQACAEDDGGLRLL